MHPAYEPPPVFDNGICRLYQADARHIPLPDESVHCVVTSPPYWGLRVYHGLEPLVWGAEGCEHEWGEPLKGSSQSGALGGSTLEGTPAGMERRPSWSSSFCIHCAAWRGSLGLEPSLELYVQHVVEVFREVRRVLRKDGTLWLNLGDSYAGSGRGMNGDGSVGQAGVKQLTNRGSNLDLQGRPDSAGQDLKPKDLIGIPWRVALALQADGWWLRSDIIWAKPNPMPESVQDRPTRSHEYLFLLTKAADYYYDADAVREPFGDNRQGRDGSLLKSERNRGGRTDGFTKPNGIDPSANGGRNKRSVWTIASQPFLGAHFATFPEKLVEPCLLAGTSEKGCCPDCKAPWGRVVEKETGPSTASWWGSLFDDGRNLELHPNVGRRKATTMNVRVRDAKCGVATAEEGYAATTDEIANYGKEEIAETKTIGWQPTCQCAQEDTVPCLVLDPFAGSGTVCVVAQKLGRRAVGCDLSRDYLTLAAKRLEPLSLPLVSN